jgi:hypothetical protein
MADQRELQRKNQELIRKNRQLEHELQKQEKALAEVAKLLWRNVAAKRLLSKRAIGPGLGTRRIYRSQKQSQHIALFQ